MRNKFIKVNGFPTRYGYACGHGKRDGEKSMFENESHTCVDIKYWKNGERVWLQFYHVEYGTAWKAIREAEKAYRKI